MDNEKYVLLKRDLFWRPDAAGYTGVLAEAGRYERKGMRVDGYEIADHYDAGRPELEVYAIRESIAPEFTRSCDRHIMANILMAERDALKMALTRVATPNAFYVATANVDPETFARMTFADKILKGVAFDLAEHDTETETRARYPIGGVKP